MSGWLAALLTGAAVWAGWPTPSRLRIRSLRRPATESPATADADTAWLNRLQTPLTLVSALGGYLFFDGVIGVAAALGAGAFAWRVLGQAESRASVRRGEQLQRELPLAVHLLGACLGAGAPLNEALGQVAAAVTGPVAAELAPIHHRLQLGADPLQVWSQVGKHPQLADLGRVLTRALESGASVKAAIDQLADELFEDAAMVAQQRARKVEVLTAAPLGVCFLPAFIVLAIVPLVAGVFAGFTLWG